MAYTFDEPKLGLMQIAQIDAGTATAQSTSDTSITTTYPTAPNKLGMVVRAFDPTYGEGEFILLKGVASTVVGSCVVWDGTTYATTLVAVTTNQARPVAFSMAANTAATTFSWYQITGTAIAAKSAVSINAKVAIGVKSTGKIGNTATGVEIEGARSANAATIASTTTTIQVVLDRPALQGRVT